jgi:hypothetical protein
MPQLRCAVQCEMGFSWPRPWYAATSHQTHRATHGHPPHLTARSRHIHHSLLGVTKSAPTSHRPHCQPALSAPAFPTSLAWGWLIPRARVWIFMWGESENTRQGWDGMRAVSEGSSQLRLPIFLLRLPHLLFLKENKKNCP